MKKASNYYWQLLGTFLLIFLNSFAQKTEYDGGRGQYPNRVFYNLEKYWDTTKICNNPHKGWTVHYYDDGITRYGNGLSKDDALRDFPCLNDIYLRLAWAYLEPEEGKYNWLLLDSVIEKWTKRGHTISFCITNKETDDHLPYAVPEWLVKAGAKGKLVEAFGNKAWAPDYGDSIFLQKLENFHKAFAERYDSMPWVEYIDVGSIGEWGEGHTLHSGWYDVPVSVIKKHIDIFKKYYKKSTLVISDDIIGLRIADDSSDDEIRDYCIQNGIGFRDNSIGVPWYTKNFGYSNVRLPEIFNKVYKTIPVVLESDHYTYPVKEHTWNKGSHLVKAVEEMHATMVGFHHFPREWLNENKTLARRLGNRSGYWYFPKYALLPDTLRKDARRDYLKLTWENHGVAPAYKTYQLKLKLINKATRDEFTQLLAESDNKTWFPNEIVTEKYSVDLTASLKSGKYDVLISLFDACGFHNKSLDLPLSREREVEKGWYKVGEVIVE